MSRPPARHPAVHWRRLDDETLCYRDGALHRLDAPTTLVWLLLDGHSDEPAIVQALHEVTGEPVPRLAADVRAVLGRLGELGLLEG
ncbi:MAG TPA: PqqD family protein [Mycobacteriales bacterium]|nr:PqqD family protein [Mycobacteriales bacterium]